jgi:hypothetical protein
MATVAYSDPAIANLPSSFDIARRDDFFGFGNAMQAIDSITPKDFNPDGTVQRPTQVITTVSGGGMPPDMVLASSGGTFFDLRPPSEIFAEMDARLSRQRQHVLNSPQTLKMLEQR